MHQLIAALAITSALLGATAALTRRSASAPLPDRPQQAVAPIATSGFLVWTGSARQGDLVTISGGIASVGSLAGALPDRPVRIKVHPAERTSDGLTVFVSDPQELPSTITTPYGPAIFLFDPRHATELSAFETPGPPQWDRLRIQANADASAFVVEWVSDYSM